ncbi:hypothetical protein SH584_01305 [Sphingomonas sp. LY29]|uniref:hypothetical protein n=1 Tax=Sphingomonas sp. LY29 TaxID=3095341 RepID=UPI002D77356E|nr:hypothetical protein [Sphingomonas sp. LY29]WRP26112.1 hypothetical protein SH584_01305 [Sphingomonas sp. LY29]
MWRWIGIVSLLLFTLSLLLPAAWLVPTEPNPRFPPFSRSGLWFLTAGWFGHFSWWANVTILVSSFALIFGRRRLAWIGILSLPLALASHSYAGASFALDHGKWRIDHFQIGYWVWVATAALPTVALLISAASRRRDARLAPVEAEQ